jgi:hypothetical protein
MGTRVAAVHRNGRGGVVLAVALAVTGCGGNAAPEGGSREAVSKAPWESPPSSGTMATGSGSLFNFNLGGGGGSGRGGDAQGLGVNAYLWRGALETLKFMPLASADPFGGVIITDWYQSTSAPGERFKVTAYILGRQLRADAIHVSVFRQVLQDGQWVNAPVAAGTGPELENKVLAAARELRAQSASNS